MTLLGLRKVFFSTPLLAIVALWAVQPTSAEAATADTPAVVALDATADLDTTADVPTDEMLLAGSNCTYYSDASYMMVVGQFGYDCCNNPVAWGSKTAYRLCGGCFPCFPPPPQ